MNWNEILGDASSNLTRFFLMGISYSFSKYYFKNKYKPSVITTIISIGSIIIASAAFSATFVLKHGLSNEFYTLTITLSVPGIIGMFMGIRNAKKPMDDTSSIINES